MADNLGSSLGGAAISGGLGIIGNLVSYGLNKKLAAQQNQYNLDMWKLQNEYNSPSAQMQRYKDAGLNPNLIYGQGNNGNASTAPQMVTPEAPNVDKTAQEIGKLFNIINLKTAAANLRESEANADKSESDAEISYVNAKREKSHYEADMTLGHNYTYDPVTGRFVLQSPEYFAEYGQKVPGGGAAKYYLMQHLHENYRRLKPFDLYPSLINLRKAQRDYLIPQVFMRNYDAQMYPETFYIDRMNKPAGAVYGLWNALRTYFGW